MSSARRLYVAGAGLVLAGTVFVAGGLVVRLVSVAAAEEKKVGPPPLKLDLGAPLLLDEPAKPATQVAKTADNSPCYVCHANYQAESMVGWHVVENIGCVDCHGDSFAHRNDENNTTPPDVIFPPRKIDASCAECHEEHDVPAQKVIARLLERCPEKTDATALVCTDCHGEHRLKVRTVVWDKETRKLLSGKVGKKPAR
ncbi:MAG: cytochrome c3 family protein [Thermoguttaceae bacterium]|jgi:hypothetical protein